MNKILNIAASLVVGVLVSVAVGVGVTEMLDPYVWPSLMLGLPAGLVAGAVALPLTYIGLTARSERRETGSVSTRTRRQLRTLISATAGFVVGGGLAMAVLWTQAVGLATAMLFGAAPVGLVTAAVAGYLAFRSKPGDRRPPSSTTQ